MRCLLALLALAVLAGCADTLFRPDEAHEVAGLLAKYRRDAASSVQEQRRELSAAQAAYDKTPNDTARLSLALAMLLPQVPPRDDTALQLLLAAVGTGTSEASARYDLAQALLALVAERQRAQRDDQRKLDQLARQLRDEKRRGDDMQQKIESLRDIDRDMRSRKKNR